MLFVSDLDDTLIHSHKTVQVDDICVEFKNGKKLSYIRPEAYSLLREIAKELLFVPITTRSLEQYQRLDLGVNPKYALAAHGALLLVDGKVDERWTLETRRMIPARLPKLHECSLWYDIRYVDGYFVQGKSERPRKTVELLRSIVDISKFAIYTVQNKFYVIPVDLNKGTALKRLKDRLQAGTVICAGDSELDISMLELADVAIAPETLALAHKNLHVCNRNSIAFETLTIVRKVFSEWGEEDVYSPIA